MMATMLTRRRRWGLSFDTVTWILVIMTCRLLICRHVSAQQYVVGVGPGRYTKVQDALDAAPAGSRIVVMAGTYREKVVVRKPSMTLIGTHGATTIVFNDSAGTSGGTERSATVTIATNARSFTAVDMVFENDFGVNGKGALDQQAVALNVVADSSFYNCTLKGWQDTLFANEARQYYKNCYIEGSVDFTFGSATAFFEDCTLFAKKRVDSKYTSYTAQKRKSATDTNGFVFLRGKLDCNPGVKALLGRGWGPFARTIFIFTIMEDCVTPEGWGVFKKYPTFTNSTFFAEYNCSGPGSNRAGRVPWSRVLTEQEALFFSNKASFIGGS